MNDILFAVLLVGGIGLLIGIILAVASIVFAVAKDEKAEAIEQLLPGANCGACGYSGCSGYAAALAKGEAKPGLCSPGGEETASAVAELLGVDAQGVVKRVALVHCNGSLDNTENKMEYQGIASCAAAAMLHGGPGKCAYGCIGFGDCAAACSYGAVKICSGSAHIDPAKCRGCSMCAEACPQRLISMQPLKAAAVVRCKNCDKGAQTRNSCQIGCIGCMKCVKACEYGAVKVESFCASVDPEKCTACGKCAEVCPRGCISLLNI